MCLSMGHDLIVAFSSDAPGKWFAHRNHQGSLNRSVLDANPVARRDSVQTASALGEPFADVALDELPLSPLAALTARSPTHRWTVGQGSSSMLPRGNTSDDLVHHLMARRLEEVASWIRSKAYCHRHCCRLSSPRWLCSSFARGEA